MKKILFTLFTLFTSYLFFTYLSAVIVEAPNLNRFEDALETIDQQSLVLFDVDETLLVPKDLILNRNVREIFNKYARETVENPEIVPPGKYDDKYFLGQVLSKIEYEVVDLKILEIIRFLQSRNIKTIAFTKMPVGPLGIIPSMEDWRIAHLKKHHFDFSAAFPQLQEMRINVLSTGIPSLFKKGMLCANNQDKGPVFIAFLEAIQWRPSKVIFIDNRLDYLKSVETALEVTGIEFVGFHYKEVENRPHIVNEHIAKFQLLHLAQTGEWLSDQEATASLSIENKDTPVVVFDFGGVIAHPNRTQMSNFLINSFNISEDELSSALRNMQNYISMGGSEKEFWEHYAVSKKIMLPNDWFNQFGVVIKKSITEIPETLILVKALQSQGYQIAMLSDVTQYQAEIIRKMGYYDLFNPVLLSYEIGVKKPNPEAFQILLQTLKRPASSLLFIDDRSENVEAAKNQGIDAIHFINPKQLKEQLERRGFKPNLPPMMAQVGFKSDMCWCIPYQWLEGFYNQIGFKKVPENQVPLFFQERVVETRKIHPQVIVMVKNYK